MKKLLVFVLAVVLLGSCSSEGYLENNYVKTISSRSYSGVAPEINELCYNLKVNKFSSNNKAQEALDKILSVTGMSKRFVLKECNGIDNCVAVTFNGIRYILYDKYFMKLISENSSSWSNLSILSHEVGHHVNGHNLGTDSVTLKESRQMEIEADEYSGFVMQKLGASLKQAQNAIKELSFEGDDKYNTHPSKDKRLAAVEIGFNRAKGQSSSYSNTSSTLTAEDYFYRAYNSPENSHQFKIDNYDMCINLNYKYKSNAYFDRGISKYELEDYYGAIADYNKVIELDPDNASAYYNRGISKYELEDYYGAIADYNKVIELDPDKVNAYYIRGSSKCELEDYYGAIADYNKVIELDPDNVSAYINRGISKNDLKDYYGAIADHTKAIEIDPDKANAYLNRGAPKSKLKDYYGAIADYTKAIEIDPDNASAYYNRGISKYELHNERGAIADYTKVIELEPDNADAYINRGWAKFYIGFGIKLQKGKGNYKKNLKEDISDQIDYCFDFKKACELGDCKEYNELCK